MSTSTSLLVIEDSREDVEVLYRAFKKLDFSHPVQTYETADLAWMHLTSATGNPAALPSLILLDLNLPGMDGRAFLRRIKEHEELRPIPVVILSTSMRDDDVEFCYRHGAAAYHTKMMDLPGQIENIRRLLLYWFDTALLPRATAA